MRTKNHKRKIFLIIASVFMILTGILRGSGGIALFLKGSRLNTTSTIVASSSQQFLVATGLLLIGAFLVFSAIFLVVKYSKKSWNACWIALIVFFLLGLANGYFLFGHSISKGQNINMFVVLITGLFLFLGKPAIKKS